ncbi:Fatty-acid amide hydrolase 2 [Strongyloides ratti]|uniref:Fatty-acid amide hydrolase 2 n=1 Tax=Strongyloides ratti TaxID=34506 RepID=A0A090MZV5_STRRB|nr:Fatty-acid amide hydrolase 2 [Strongyloides ratti]CEF69595.1 Fatty-acid amide hydrolase 2 [Strongyloides ratti]
MVLLFPFIDSEKIYQLPYVIIVFLQFTHTIYCTIINTIFYIYLFLSKKKSLPKIENELLLIPGSECARMIRNKEISSYDLVKAYIDRQKQVNPYINAVVMERYEDALNEAKKIDKFLINIQPDTKEYYRIVEEKPLLGVPFTLKNSIKCKEFSPISGVVCRNNCNTKADIFCKGIERWKEAGGILIASTNVPELCMWIETNNKVWGRTNNPYDIRRTAGGSSGGEGAIIASGGSLFGVGSDIAGSIRIPASHCGIFGYKNTPKSIDVTGHVPEPDDKIMNMIAQAPMARYACDLKLICKIYMSYEEKILLKMNDEVDINNLKFYYIEDFSYMEAQPVTKDCLQGVRSVIKMLEDYNKFAINICIDEFKYTNVLWQATLQEHTNDDVTGISCYMNNFSPVKIPFLKESLKNIFNLKSDHDLGVMLWLFEFGNIRFLQPKLKRKYIEMREKLIKRINDILGDNGILIVPGYPTVAPPHNHQLFLRMDKSYTEIFNVLGLPVITCPIFLDSSGIPVCVQIVAGKNQDRLLFTFAEVIEKKFGGWKEPK